MAVLYQNYRPKTFGEVINQEHIKTTLQNAVQNGSFAHAYLFTGPRGTGKTSVARIFARAINCLHPKKGEPDNTCEICTQFMSGKALDLVEIDAASNTGVENIREMIEHLKFSPAQAAYKVFIVDEVHMLSKGAFNALLKTLEEPPKHAVFILATTEVHKVPATVISRTQRFDFKKIESTELLKLLKTISKKENINIDEQSLTLVVNAAEGGARDALSILDKLSQFGDIDAEHAEMLLGITNVSASQKLLDLLVAKDAKGALEYLEELFSAGIDPIQLNKDFLEYLRKLLMHTNGANIVFALDDAQLKKMQSQGSVIRQGQLMNFIRLFLRANKDFQTSPSAELPLEIAAAESCFLAVTPGQEVHNSHQPTIIASAPEIQDDPESENIPAPAAKRGIKKMVSIEQLHDAWPKILEIIRSKQSSLLTIMKSVSIKSLEQNILQLGCAYKFHKDNLELKKNRALLIGILDEYFDSEFDLQVILEKTPVQDRMDTASSALEVFGGEAV